MDYRPNILIVSSFWVDEDVGGVAEMSLVLARELAKNHQVTVLINRWDAPVPRHEHREGFDLIFFRIYSPWNSRRSIRNVIRWLLALPSQLHRIGKLLRDREIDIVQIRFPVPSYYIFRVLRLLGGPPYCVSLHGSDVWLFGKCDAFSRALVRWVFAGASGTSAVSSSLASDAQRLFPSISAIRTIRNGKPLDHVKASRDPPETALKSQIVKYFFINPANVTRRKGQEALC